MSRTLAQELVPESLLDVTQTALWRSDGFGLRQLALCLSEIVRYLSIHATIPLCIGKDLGSFEWSANIFANQLAGIVRKQMVQKSTKLHAKPRRMVQLTTL
jgi:hypothetical protein